MELNLLPSVLAVELLLDIRNKLRMMGIEVEKTSKILGANKAVIMNMQLPSSTMKKKHNSVAFHKSREAMTAGICQAGHINENQNLSDILTKSLGPNKYYKYIMQIMYGNI